MRIGIDFDDTIVNTTKKVREYMDRYNVINFKDIYEQTDFYKKHLDDITKEVELKDNVIEVLNKLSKDNDLFLITARSDFYSPTLLKTTEDYIKKYNLPFKELYFDCYAEQKASKCKELNIDLFIDDDINNCDATFNDNIKTILFGNEIKQYKSYDNWNDILKEVYDG